MSRGGGGGGFGVKVPYVDPPTTLYLGRCTVIVTSYGFGTYNSNEGCWGVLVGVTGNPLRFKDEVQCWGI